MIDVTEHTGLIGHATRRYKGMSFYDDACGDAAVGLVIAGQRWKPDSGSAFAHYAMIWMRSMIGAGIARQTAASMSDRSRQSARQIAIAEDILLEDLGREPTRADIAEFLNISVDAVTRGQLSVQQVSIEQATMAEEDAGFRGSREIDNSLSVSFPDIDATLDVGRAMAELEDVDASVVKLRYIEGLSATATARELGMSRQRVAQREGRALEQLRGLLAVA